MSVKNRAQLKTENATDFPDNTDALISPADLRGQMDDVVDSATLKEDAPTLYRFGVADDANTGIGAGVMSHIAGGFWNTGISDSSLSQLTTGYSNIAVGFETLKNITVGFQNIAIGVGSQVLPITCNNNVGLGVGALASVTSGNDNTALGNFAMRTFASGNDNLAVGKHALDQAISATDNVAIGADALRNSPSSINNVAVGRSALLGASGGNNAIVGAFAGDAVTTGNNNASLGYNSLGAATTGANNIAIGSGAGGTITTGTGNTIIGQAAAASAAAAVDQIVIGRGVTGVGNSACTLGAGANTATLSLDGTDTSWAAASDGRLKTDVEDYQVGLSFIEALRPVTFNWRVDARRDKPVRGLPGKRYMGFVAQEVRAVLDAHSDVPNGQHLWDEKDGVQTIAPAALIPMLVNAVKQLAAEVASLKARQV